MIQCFFAELSYSAKPVVYALIRYDTHKPTVGTCDFRGIFIIRSTAECRRMYKAYYTCMSTSHNTEPTVRAAEYPVRRPVHVECKIKKKRNRTPEEKRPYVGTDN